MMRQTVLILVLPLLLPGGRVLSAADEQRKGMDFFEAKIRPMLVTHCYQCHSAGAAAKQNLKAGLLLDSREGSRSGGESGPAVVPGKPDESLLISALRHEGLEMPPKGKLPDEIIGHFVKWIEMGAPDPRESTGTVVASEIDIAAGRSHWAFQPLTDGKPPALTSPESEHWVRTPVDRFIRSRIDAAGITPNETADARTLIRRATFDLTGLPPTPQQVSEFVAAFDRDPRTAYQSLIDELLASEHYGERWARHWLDIVRFAESNGYAFDGDRPNAWHYRDFVIRALNADLPYDEFVRQQIAGDLLADMNPTTASEARETVNTIAATGFLVAGPYTTQQTQKERERSRYEQLDDIVSTLSTSLLGLTVGCARCHSHKFDPLPQYDYYRLASCFADVGFADTGVNNRPEEFRAAQAAYEAVHQPLLTERTRFETEQLSSRAEAWLVGVTAETRPVAPALMLTPWQHAGPFPAESFEKAFEQAFAPESQVDLKATYREGSVRWMAHPDWTDGVVHNPFVGDNAANYLYRTIDSPVEQAVALSLGSDDAIKVWVNGKEVLSKLIGRGAEAGQEMLEVPVQQGANQILIKIVNGAGPSGFYFAASPKTVEPLQGLEHWHHVGPFTAGGFDAAFDQVFEPELDTDLGRTFDSGKLKWVAQPEWTDGEAHNDKLSGTNCANYLYREIVADRPRVLSLSLGSDDGIKLWVNGREVLSKKVGRNVAAAGQESVSIQLAPGRSQLLMKIVNGGGATGFYFAAANGQTPADVLALLQLPEDKRTDQQRQKLIDWYKGFDLDWLRLNQAVVRHESQQPKPELTNVFAARVRGTTYQFGEDTYKVYHLRRGNADNKEQEAQPGFLQVLMRADDQEQAWLSPPEDTSQSRPGRLGLVDWLTDVDNGAGHLLARVIVNRLWHHHFGRGLVATPSDFGTRGERPSHPELLDWLASELIRGGWKLKPIHRLIMTSNVYMQAGDVTETGRRLDPENLLIWRRSARRLEAEVIRDSLLSVSGTLDLTMYGPGTLDDRSRRRSLYFTVKRSRLIPMLQLFDAPDAMQGISAREESTVAPQALALLNSPILREVAAQLAQRVRPNAETTIQQTIQRTYEVALGRPASGAEMELMAGFIERQRSLRGAASDAESLAVRDFCHLVLCMNEFVYVD